MTVNPDALLRLEDAVKEAFPLGGMTVKGLRRERDAGRLVTEKIAGKEFTSLRSIEEMRRQCRVPALAHTSSSDDTKTAGQPSGSLKVSREERSEALLSAQMLMNNQKLTRLRQSSRKSATRRRRRKSSVIPIKR